MELNNNKLNGDDFNILVNKCPNIRKIKIENNNIQNINNFKNLLGLNIKKLNVKGNPFTKNNINYVKELFDIFLSLICIDDCDKEGNDIDSTEYGDALNFFDEDKDEESNEDGLDSFENNENNEENEEIEDNEIEDNEIEDNEIEDDEIEENEIEENKEERN